MEHSAFGATSSSSSQRRELQGPRPAPLRVHKESHKVRKPPAQVRQPVIIYTVSPKVVHANPSEFMSVVQRLTGVASSSSSSALPQMLPPPPTSSSSVPFPFFPQPSSSSAMLPPTLPQPQLPFPFQLQAAWLPPHDGALLQFSPAARLAAMEQASASAARSGAGVHPAGGLPPLPSILSPVPGNLPAIPASFFSPQAAGGINLFGELISPAFLAGASSTPPPTSQYFPAAPSPSPYYWDLFNNNHHL